MQYDLSEFALKVVAPSNKLIYDDKGIPSVMVPIPKLKISDLIAGGSDSVHPAFIVNGKEIDRIWISKFQNIVNNGRGYSHPGVPPANSMTWDTARGYCESKGPGWHMMSKAEWGLLLLWCVKNGTLPWGNNNYGRDSRASMPAGIPCTYEADGKTRHILTGSGPLSYSHNGQIDGIWDLNGNVSEWGAGVRTVKGELQFLPNNDAANRDNLQTAASSAWKALDATTGKFITPDGSGTTPNSVKVDCISGIPKYSTAITTRNASFGTNLYKITCDSTIAKPAKEILIAYGFLPATEGGTDIYDSDVVYFNNTEEATERLFNCGGDYGGTGSAGVGYGNGNYYSRGYASAYIGFRSAFYEVD